MLAVVYMKSLLSRITHDRYTAYGQPCIRDTRVPVSVLLDLVGEGLSGDQILVEHPELTAQDLGAAIAFRLAISLRRPQ